MRPQTTVVGARRWVLLAALIGVYFGFAVAVSSIAPMLNLVRDDLGASRGQMGFALGAWAMMFIVTAPMAGRFVDRFGVGLSIGIGAFFVSASLAARSVATGIPTLWLAIAIFGIGGPLISVGAPALVKIFFRDERERRMAVAFYVLAPGLGGVVTVAITNPILLPLLGDWRTVLLAESGFALLMAILWVVIYRLTSVLGTAVESRESSTDDLHRGDGAVANESVDHLADAQVDALVDGAQVDALVDGAQVDALVDGAQVDGAQVDGGAPKGQVRELLASAGVRFSLATAFSIFFVNHALSAWFPAVLEDVGSLSASAASSWVAASGVVSIAVALVVPPLAVANRQRKVLFLCLGAVLMGIVFLALGTAPTVPFVALLIGVRGPLVPLGILILMNSEGVGDHNAGLANGLWFAVGEIGGVSGPLLLGVIADTTLGFSGALLTVAAIAGGVAILGVVVTNRLDRQAMTGAG